MSIKFAFQNPPTKTTPGPESFIGKLCQLFLFFNNNNNNKNNIKTIYGLFQKKREYTPTNFMRLALP